MTAITATRATKSRVSETATRSETQGAKASRFAFLLVVLSAAFGSNACEDKAIGRVCELSVDGGAQSQAVVNSQALECPTRLCLRPAQDINMAERVDTTSLCSAECSKDSDCDGGETRKGTNMKDFRCKGGFVCGVATVTGSYCCKKLCMCKDFLTIPASGLETPKACDRSVNPMACPLVK